MSDSNSELGAAKIAAIATIVASVCAAAVSYVVSNREIELAAESAYTDNVVKKATLFSSLMEKASLDGNVGYSILALWKLYEDDRRLVIITALQSENPQAIAVLELLQLENQLTPYADTVEGVLHKAEGERKEVLRNLYAKINPNGVVDERIDAILAETKDEFYLSPDFEELVALCRENPAMVAYLEKVYDSDARISDSLLNRFTFSLALYQTGNTERLLKLVEEYEANLDNFGQLASLLSSDLLQDVYRKRDYESFAKASIRYMVHVNENSKSKELFLNGLTLFEMAKARAYITGDERDQVLASLEAFFRGNPGLYDRHKVLIAVQSLDSERAVRMFHMALACEEDGSIFFMTTADTVLESIYLDSDVPDYDAARIQSTSWRVSNSLACDSWRSA